MEKIIKEVSNTGSGVGVVGLFSSTLYAKHYTWHYAKPLASMVLSSKAAVTIALQSTNDEQVLKNS